MGMRQIVSLQDEDMICCDSEHVVSLKDEEMICCVSEQVFFFESKMTFFGEIRRRNDSLKGLFFYF